MTEEFDVLVVGAGPSGSTAARHAAMGGARTLLIEKRSEIGTPVRCGEGVAKRWLDEVGLEPSGSFIAHEVDGAKVVAPDGTTLVVDEARAGNECGYILERDLFDRHLAKLAAKAGAVIRIRTSATALLQEDGRVVGARLEGMGRTYDVRSKVVLGADGIESQVGRWAGLEKPLRTRDIDACLQYTMVGVQGDPSLNEFYLGSWAPGGYAWVFWKDTDIANVGLGVNLSKLRDKAETKAYLDRFISAHPHLGRGEILEEVAGMVSVALPLERTGMPGLLLVGDAARLIDPVTGGGILNGCLTGKYSGELAAQAVKDGDAGEAMVKAYEKRWRARLEESLYRNYLIKEKLLTMDDDLVNRIIRAIAEVGLERVSTHEILSALRKKHPELVAEFESFL
ncbi:MAG: NAD(P)/FAD-dependent oxidoreductase [Methanobacteriota archaeon]|nr:MAG: NAD(P)/FAD-dependent oxidoreductase [Euryarchaeota archaeon]